LDVVPTSVDLAPASLWIDLSHTEGYRVAVPDDGQLRVKGLQVLSSALELCP
jgi:hypothetical protein